MALIDRVDNPTAEAFAQKFLLPNLPAVVLNAMPATVLDGYWTPRYLRAHFGDQPVQVYDDDFKLLTVSTLGKYLGKYFDKNGAPSGRVPYVRWYSRSRDIEFAWSDEVIEAMRTHWQTPACMPLTDLALPYAPAPCTRDPRSDLFPGRGIFISGQGARTGLHIDPWGSDAFLCQLYGKKHWRVYAPEQAPRLVSGAKTADPDNIDATVFPRAREAVPDYEFVQEPGEVVYVPSGWFHIVKSVTDCISLTWNFVDFRKRDALRAWLDSPVSEVDLAIVKFFLGARGAREWMNP